MYKVVSVTIKTNQQGNDMIAQFKKDKAITGAFDTETNSLHIMLAKPFLFQFGWIVEDEKLIRTYVVDIQRQPDLANQVIKAWHILAATLQVYLGHNVKYDLHMMCNLSLIHI